MSELVVACKVLPDFGALRILYFPTTPSHPICWCVQHGPLKERWEQGLEKQEEVMKGLAGLLEDTDDGVSGRRGAEESHGEDG